jgi:plasmid segregation protein ParM
MISIGLDIGYGYTKAVASNGKKIIFPSLVGEGFKRQYGGLFFEHKLNTDNMHVEIDGTDYFIGKLASMESRNCS